MSCLLTTFYQHFFFNSHAQRAAARILSQIWRFDHTSCILSSLHRLLVWARYDFRYHNLCIAYKWYRSSHDHIYLISPSLCTFSHLLIAGFWLVDCHWQSRGNELAVEHFLPSCMSLKTLFPQKDKPVEFYSLSWKIHSIFFASVWRGLPLKLSMNQIQVCLSYIITRTSCSSHHKKKT